MPDRSHEDVFNIWVDFCKVFLSARSHYLSLQYGTKYSCFSLTCAVAVQFIIQGMAFGHRGVTLVNLRGRSKVINFLGAFFLSRRVPYSCLTGKDVDVTP